MGQKSTIDSKKKKGSQKVSEGWAQTRRPEIKLAGQLHFATCSKFPRVTGYGPSNDRRRQAWGQRGHGVLSGHSHCLDCLESVVFSGLGGLCRAGVGLGTDGGWDGWLVAQRLPEALQQETELRRNLSPARG